jgi:hypothetical protein
MSFDAREIALFVALHGNWSSEYHGPRIIPRRFLGVSIDAVTYGFSELVREIRKLLPSAVAAMAERKEDDPQGQTLTVLFADPKDISRLRKQHSLAVKRSSLPAIRQPRKRSWRAPSISG